MAANLGGVLVDRRELKQLAPAVVEALRQIQSRAALRGMQRSCVILASDLAIAEAKQLAQESGIYAWERYIDARSNPNWRQTALNWIQKGIDPDKA